MLDEAKIKTFYKRQGCTTQEFMDILNSHEELRSMYNDSMKKLAGHEPDPTAKCLGDEFGEEVKDGRKNSLSEEFCAEDVKITV